MSFFQYFFPKVPNKIPRKKSSNFQLTSQIVTFTFDESLSLSLSFWSWLSVIITLEYKKLSLLNLVMPFQMHTYTHTWRCLPDNCGTNLDRSFDTFSARHLTCINSPRCQAKLCSFSAMMISGVQEQDRYQNRKLSLSWSMVLESFP